MMNVTSGAFWNASELSWAPSKCDGEKAIVVLYCFVATLCAINIFACVLHRVQRRSEDPGQESV